MTDESQEKEAIAAKALGGGAAAEDEDPVKTKKPHKKKKKDKKKKKKKSKQEEGTRKRKSSSSESPVKEEEHHGEADAEGSQKKKKKKRARSNSNISQTSSIVINRKRDRSDSNISQTSVGSFHSNNNPQQQEEDLLLEAKARPIVQSSAIFKDKTETEATTDKDDTKEETEKKSDAKKSDTSDEAATDANERSNNTTKKDTCTLLLFYQYVEPPWSDAEYKHALAQCQKIGQETQLSGRMRVAKEGLNCTLTGTKDGIFAFCRALRRWRPQIFTKTEFKLTHDLPVSSSKFQQFKIIPVIELVHYGLEGKKAPPIAKYHGTHLEPKQYHEKLAQKETVVIDVRNHYEAAIGRFDPPEGTAQWLDPMMRKSTEFPVWLDSDATKEQLRGKQVLMYCTGGIRCERASALLKYKMEHDPAVQDLNIQGVYQLQGGIDKYFKQFPEGGYWKGKNYVFDRRTAHAPAALEQELYQDKKPAAADAENEITAQDDQKEQAAHAKYLNGKQESTKSDNGKKARKGEAGEEEQIPMGRCEACNKPWDKYAGKRRCPTCGVPSLTCRDCYQADLEGRKKLDRNVRCDLCVAQNIRSKKDLRAREERELRAYEAKMEQIGLLHPPQLEGETEESGRRDDTADSGPMDDVTPADNPNQVTRLFLKNMCRRQMTEEILMQHLPGITHIVWRLNGKTRQFFGQGWVEMKTPDDAARAVAQSGSLVILGRPLYVEYQPPDGKDLWPPKQSAVA